MKKFAFLLLIIAALILCFQKYVNTNNLKTSTLQNVSKEKTINGFNSAEQVNNNATKNAVNESY
ncbi:hypothetical protein KBA27_00015 [bacterium]|nr:hypothetical protein [bacterium]